MRDAIGTVVLPLVDEDWVGKWQLCGELAEGVMRPKQTRRYRVRALHAALADEVRHSPLTGLRPSGSRGDCQWERAMSRLPGEVPAAPPARRRLLTYGD